MRVKRRPDEPDLASQLEELLVQVLDSERRERMNDRIDALCAAEELRAKRQADRESRMTRKFHDGGRHVS